MLKPRTQTENLEQQIAAMARDVDICNAKIADIVKVAQERDRLRDELWELTKCYLAKRYQEQAAESPKQCIFAYNGKNKDLLAALQAEIQKAQN